MVLPDCLPWVMEATNLHQKDVKLFFDQASLNLVEMTVQF